MKRKAIALGVALLLLTTVPVPAALATSDIGQEVPGGGAAEQLGGWTYDLCVWANFATCS